MNTGRHAPIKKRQVDANASAAIYRGKPKRPLSGFNLFYRFKRQKVLAAIAQGETKKENITRLVQVAPGLEDRLLNGAQEDGAAPRDLSVLRRDNIIKDLRHNLLPRDTSERSHRTNQSAMNGSMTFLELARLMNVAWKECDDLAKCVFKELSDESRRIYRERLREYKASREAMGTLKVAAPPPKQSSKANSSPRREIQQPPPTNKQSSKDSSPVREIQRLPPLKNSSPCEEIQRPTPTKNDASNNDLMLRVRELEGQLEAERLRSRVRELEGLVGTQRTVEEQLRAQIAASSGAGRAREIGCLLGGRGMVEDALRSRLASSSAVRAREFENLLERQMKVQDELRARLARSSAVRARELSDLLMRQKAVEDRLVGPLPSGPSLAAGGSHGATGVPTAHPPPGGLSALVNASMIHPSLQASGRADAPLSSAAAKCHTPVVQELGRDKLGRQLGQCTDDAAPKKKQRRE